MTAALSPALASTIPPVADDEPVALLQLCVTGHDWALADAASAVYREIRQGRRVVAVASGASDAADQLARKLDEIGVDAAVPGAGEALLTAEVSVVQGPERIRTQPRSKPGRVLRVALAGCGVVGGGLLPRLRADPRFELVGVLVRDPGRTRDVEVPPNLLLTDPGALLAREPDVLIEVTSDAPLGLALTRAALARKVHVVSASKQAISADLAALEALARASDAQLAYSAAVGGGAPLIETVQRASEHGEIVRIEGVLNGTCNYILNRLADGATFDEAVTAAQSAGFAEADPSADLSGLDAAAKLSILAHVARYFLPATSIARQSMECRKGRIGVRQVSRFDSGSGSGTVALEPVEWDPFFGDLADERNALRATTADGRCFVATGRGAGRMATCESVWGDLLDLADI